VRPELFGALVFVIDLNRRMPDAEALAEALLHGERI
jgi:hypothetical protein